MYVLTYRTSPISPPRQKVNIVCTYVRGQTLYSLATSLCEGIKMGLLIPKDQEVLTGTKKKIYIYILLRHKKLNYKIHSYPGVLFWNLSVTVIGILYPFHNPLVSNLRGMDTHSREATVKMVIVPYWKGIFSKWKEFAPRGSKFLPFRVDTFSEGRNAQ